MAGLSKDYPDYAAFAKENANIFKAVGDKILVFDHSDEDFSVYPTKAILPAKGTACMVVINIGPGAAKWAEENHVLIGKTAVLFPSGVRSLVGSPDREWMIYSVDYHAVETTTSEWTYHEMILNPKMSEKRLKKNGHIPKKPGLIGKILGKK